MKLWPFCVKRRADARRRTALEAKFVLRNALSGKRLSPPCPCRVLNLSPRGCCLALSRLNCGGLHLHRCLEAPQDYIFEITLAPHNGDSRQFTAEVRWLNREMDDQLLPFRAGLEFPVHGGHSPLLGWWHVQNHRS